MGNMQHTENEDKNNLYCKLEYLFISDFRPDGNKTKSYGHLNALFVISTFTSSIKDVPGMTKSEKQFYITSELAKYNIKIPFILSPLPCVNVLKRFVSAKVGEA